jgi:hypothetical protein
MSNRTWLKELVADDVLLHLEGTHRLETRHTIYMFRDGICVDIARRGADDGSHADASMIGMRIVGWLIEIEDQRRLLACWLPGARAVLWRAPSERGASKIALTSASLVFVECSWLDDIDDDDCVTAVYTPLPSHAVASGSFTRLFPQAR